MGIVLILLLVALVWGVMYLSRHPETILKWVSRRMMPPNMREQMKQAEKKRREQEKRARSGRPFWQRSASSPAADSAPIIPKEYAQDVEFTESKIYESDVEISRDGRRVKKEKIKIEVESQVSDAEWEDIK